MLLKRYELQYSYGFLLHSKNNYNFFQDEDAKHNDTEDMVGAASTLIREWAENLLNVKFPTLSTLGKYLVNNFCVNNDSVAAMCMKNTLEEPVAKTG